jgi:hypothetical protein
MSATSSRLHAVKFKLPVKLLARRYTACSTLPAGHSCCGASFPAKKLNSMSSSFKLLSCAKLAGTEPEMSAGAQQQQQQQAHRAAASIPENSMRGNIWRSLEVWACVQQYCWSVRCKVALKGYLTCLQTIKCCQRTAGKL